MSKRTRKCCVIGCPKEVVENVEKRSDYRFPQIKKGLDRFRMWVNATGNPKFANIPDEEIAQSDPRICCIHFRSEDFYSPNRLRDTAVPSVFLPEPLQRGRAMLENVAAEPSQISVEPAFSTPRKEGMLVMVSPRKRQTPPSTFVGKDLFVKVPPGRDANLIASTSRPVILEEYADLGVQILPEWESMETSTDVTSEVATQTEEFVHHDSFRSHDDEISLITPGPSGNGHQKRKLATKRPILSLIGEKRAKHLCPGAKRLYEEVIRLRRQLSRTKSALVERKKLSKTKKFIGSEAFHQMSKSLTPFQLDFFINQIRNIPKKPRGRSFSLDLKAEAISIWKTSPACYRHLSERFALPSIGTLRATLNRVEIKPGICKPIFKVLKSQVEAMRNKKHRVCVLLFDEMALHPHLDYNYHGDFVEGFVDDGFERKKELADEVMAFMLRGIYKKWKQPCAFAFCRSAMKPETIIKFIRLIVKEATDIGLTVVATVCDQGTRNVSAINALLAESRATAVPENRDFKNDIVVAGSSLIPIFDPPHLLKSLRNNLLDKDLQFPTDGVNKTACWSHILAAYNIDKSKVLRSLFKLTDAHVLPSKMKKMKVVHAAQIMSRTMAAYLATISGLKGHLTTEETVPIEGVNTSELCLLFDEVFDSVNGGFGYSTKGKPLRGLVHKNSPHVKFWTASKNRIKAMKFIPRRSTQKARPPVLGGWEKTLDGFIALSNKLNSMGFPSFTPRMINQDPLENFFGQIRQYGVRFNKPTCKSFVPFFKSLLIRNFSSYHSTGSNCEADDSTSLVTIKEFLTQESEHAIEPSDQWHPPNLSAEGIDWFETLTIGYVSGFIVKELIPLAHKCDTCKLNLLHQGPPDEFHHKLVSAREFSGNVQRLQYVNVHLIKILIYIYVNMKTIIPSCIFHRHIVLRIVSHLRANIDLDFMDCTHSEEIQTIIFKKFVVLVITGYMRKLSNISYGKISFEEGSLDEVEKLVNKSYLSRCRNKAGWNK